MICINKKSDEYQTQLSRSGISDSQFEAYASYYIENFGRYPYLDELPNADSSKYIKDKLDINGNQTSYVRKNRLREFTLETNKDKIQKKLNSIFKDKEIELTDLDDDVSIIKIIDRPSKYNIKESEDIDITNPDSFTFFVDGLYKLSNLYGINFKMVTNQDLKLDPFSSLHASEAKAFVYNGDIYINIDQASVDSPIHEMLHLLIGSMRFTNIESYKSLIDNIQKLPEFSFLAKQFPNRTINDVSEEILIDQFSKFLTSKDSKLSQNQIYDMFYELKRNLDTLLMGNISVGSLDINQMKQMSILEIGKLVNSRRLINNYSEFHRVLNNVKSDLIKKGELEQICI